jgi:tRNA modification GTPase
VVIVGRPNVGKSSLLNALLKESRAIVTSIPGTTRDLIEEVLTYRGIPLRLVDTAGLGTASDEVEAIGISKAEEAFERADVRIWVVDGSVPPSPFDLLMAEKLRDLPHVVAVNKCDLPPGRDIAGKTTAEVIADLMQESPVLSISAMTGAGLEGLKDAAVSAIAGGGTLDNGLNATARQVGEIRDAIGFLKEGYRAMESGAGHDAAAECLTGARSAMERLLGIAEAGSGTLLDHIFSQFCVGK